MDKELKKKTIREWMRKEVSHKTELRVYQITSMTLCFLVMYMTIVPKG